MDKILVEYLSQPNTVNTSLFLLLLNPALPRFGSVQLYSWAHDAGLRYHVRYARCLGRIWAVFLKVYINFQNNYKYGFERGIAAPPRPNTLPRGGSPVERFRRLAGVAAKLKRVILNGRV